MNKLPKLAMAFWVMKICATTLGETAGDLMSMTMNVGYGRSTLILMSIFVVALGIQLASKRHIPPLYWAVILATSTAGTTMSDFMNRTLGFGYPLGSTVLIVMLIAVLLLWKAVYGTISVDTVTTLGTESFYWAAILISNTLGTSLGDYLADDSGLGFLGSAVLIFSVIGVIALAYLFTTLDRVALFWAAFVLTRPLGATVGDWLTKIPEKGGIGLGTIRASMVLAIVLLGMLAVTTWEELRESSGEGAA